MSLKPYLAESYQKEFITQMQAKGKLPRTVTEASDRHDEVYHETVDRIFPGPGGKDAVLQNMIRNSTKRIDEATAGGRGGNAMGVPDGTGRAQELANTSNDQKREQRQALKNKLREMEQQINAERMARLEIEHKLEQARENR